jgi:hypothetical protein
MAAASSAAIAPSAFSTRDTTSPMPRIRPAILHARRASGGGWVGWGGGGGGGRRQARRRIASPAAVAARPRSCVARGPALPWSGLGGPRLGSRRMGRCPCGWDPGRCPWLGSGGSAPGASALVLVPSEPGLGSPPPPPTPTRPPTHPHHTHHTQPPTRTRRAHIRHYGLTSPGRRAPAPPSSRRCPQT